jgi:hypothetical protein
VTGSTSSRAAAPAFVSLPSAISNIPVSEVIWPPSKATCTGLPFTDGKPGRIPASFWRDAQFDTIRLCLIKVAGRVTEMVTRIKIALPTAYPTKSGLPRSLAASTKLPP